MSRIYLASSWRNPLQPDLVKILERAGHEVYDFRNPPGRTGFSWKQVGGDYHPSNLTFEQYHEMVGHPVAQEGFAADANAMVWADTFVLALPCGRSAHLELGWACGRRKRTAVLFPPTPRTWENIPVGTFVPGSGRITEKTTSGLRTYVTFDREGDPFDETWSAGHHSHDVAPIAMDRNTGRLVRHPLEQLEPELMYRFADFMTDDEAKLREWLSEE